MAITLLKHGGTRDVACADKAIKERFHHGKSIWLTESVAGGKRSPATQAIPRGRLCRIDHRHHFDYGHVDSGLPDPATTVSGSSHSTGCPAKSPDAATGDKSIANADGAGGISDGNKLDNPPIRQPARKCYFAGAGTNFGPAGRCARSCANAGDRSSQGICTPCTWYVCGQIR
jgi:hypothetical protein